MSEMKPDRLRELRRIAEAATPGPWDTTRYNGGLRFDGPLRVYAGTDPEYGEPRSIPASDTDNRYIAAFDPTTVLALLDEIERLQAEIERDEALLRQVLEVLSLTHQTAMEQAMEARVPECAGFAEIFQDLDYVVASLRERLGEGEQQ